MRPGRSPSAAGPRRQNGAASSSRSSFAPYPAKAHGRSKVRTSWRRARTLARVLAIAALAISAFAALIAGLTYARDRSKGITSYRIGVFEQRTAAGSLCRCRPSVSPSRRRARSTDSPHPSRPERGR